MQIKTETRVGIFVLLAVAIFFYLTIFLGVFRLDRGSYHEYTIYFDDISGLEKKAAVKIAGVTVGWVERIELVRNDPHHAKATILVKNDFVLHHDAHGIVRQEGLLGTKFLELIPGDPLLPELPPDHSFGKPGRSPTSIDEILHKVHQITSNIEDVSSGIRESMGGVSGRDNFQELLQHINKTAESIAGFSEKLEHIMSYNEGNITQILGDFKEFAHDLKDSMPLLESNLNRIAQVFDEDFSALAKNAEETFKNLSSVASKIDDGDGLVGQLINDGAMYGDIKEAMGGIKTYMNKIDRLKVVIDTHGEYMYRPAENMSFEDAKGYVDIRIHPTEDHFYIVQIVGTQKGNLRRTVKDIMWYDENGRQIMPSIFLEQHRNMPNLFGHIEKIKRTTDMYKFGIQLCKMYKNVCLRFGMIEGSVGVGVDVQLPMNFDNFRWITSLEMFDFRGRDRIDDARPHFKWINRVFVLRNIYMAFGADDFVSKWNANAFFGCGLRFCDEDLKYLVSKIGFAGMS